MCSSDLGEVMGWAEACRAWLYSTLCAAELEANRHMSSVSEGKMVWPEDLAVVVVAVELVAAVAFAEQ